MRQDGTKGDLRPLVGKDKEGKVVPIGVWVDKGWEEIGKEVKDLGYVLWKDGLDREARDEPYHIRKERNL